MSIGKRIVELRRKVGITQLQLAEKLAVTDKAVSKWESDIGDPSIQSLMDLSRFFDISVDYLLTGEDKSKVIIMSRIQKIAHDDDINEVKKNSILINYEDDYGKNLIDYVYEYSSSNIFKFLLHSQYFRLLMTSDSQITSKRVGQYLKLCVISGELDVLTNTAKSPFFPLYIVDVIDGEPINKAFQPSICLDSDFIDFILTQDSNDKLWDLIKGSGSGIYWTKGLARILEREVINKHSKVDEIVSFVEYQNNIIDEKIRSSMNSSGQAEYYLDKGFLFKRINPGFVLATYFYATKQTIVSALQSSNYKLVDRLNKLTKNPITEYEIRMDKVAKDKTMKPRDKLKESVIVKGLIDIDKLIGIDDFDLYQEMINMPATKLEEAQFKFESSSLKDFFNYAIENDMKHTLEAIKHNQLDLVKGAIAEDFKYLKHEINNKYYDKNHPFYQSGGKKKLRFDQIENHNDIRFFEYAAKIDPDNRDRALEYLIKERPNQYQFIKLLLDCGAKLHHRWVEFPGDEDEKRHDKIDEVATQLLINQINILLTEGVKL